MSQFAGPDRRRHRMYVTKNTEYHFRDGFCVAVRDRRSGTFLPGHLALQRRVCGGLRIFGHGGMLPNPGEPELGDAMYFTYQGRDLITSPLESKGRPDKATVKAYPPLS